MACKKDKPAPPADSCPDPDTARITYNGYVANTMRQHCTSCHSGSSPSGGVALDSYQNVRRSAEQGTWYQVMLNGSMPPSGRLDDCTLSRLKRWVETGYPE
ncbi:MAG: hypothetical protein NZZ60_08030 [Bacteroidia bacterium]|nr:hypothetical protein [Bacteroidia bacterium]MCX7652348.1 hypothetical protein [Bacteroidia bacterium]MDW8417540.1 hypothetical protein [Bacteroidia bacterium]